MVNDKDVQHILFVTEGKKLRCPLQFSQPRHRNKMYLSANLHLQAWIEHGVPKEIWDKLDLSMKTKFYLKCAPLQPVITFFFSK